LALALLLALLVTVGLLPRFESVMWQSTPSKRQLVQGTPPLTTSHRTFLVRQERQAREERRFAARSLEESIAARFWPPAELELELDATLIEDSMVTSRLFGFPKRRLCARLEGNLPNRVK
jgi:hypothetical protein